MQRKISIIVTLLWMAAGLAIAEDIQPVLYMSFDAPPQNGKVIDLSGYDNDGALDGNTQWTDKGKFGGAIVFDGDSFIEVPHSDSLSLNKALTVEIWFKTTEAISKCFLIYHGDITSEVLAESYDWGLYVTGESSRVHMYLRDDKGGIVSPQENVDVADGKWHLLACTYDGVTAKLYFDGEMVGEADWNLDIRPSKGSLVIGAWEYADEGTRFVGVLDEVRVFDVVLTDEQIESDYETADGYPSFAAVAPNDKLSTVWGRIKSERSISPR